MAQIQVNSGPLWPRFARHGADTSVSWPPPAPLRLRPARRPGARSEADVASDRCPVGRPARTPRRSAPPRSSTRDRPLAAPVAGLQPVFLLLGVDPGPALRHVGQILAR